MKIYNNPSRSQWAEITARPVIDLSGLNATVDSVLADVKTRGDEAVKDYERQFDKADLDSLTVTTEEIDHAYQAISPELRVAIEQAYHNISAFHEAQRFHGVRIETMPGVECWQKSVPIERVGLYVPGGTAPLFSTVLMLAIPAAIAGCKEIVLCTPPAKDGTVHHAILAAAKIAGVGRIFKAGGVQAIAAMAYGTESVPKVYKIFGPGNRFVMTAKQRVSLHDVAIDMPAGPSEVCVIADKAARADYVAADLLSQCEHGTDSQAIFITDSPELLRAVEAECKVQLESLPRRDIAAASLANSRLVLVADMEEAISLSNEYAPEHLILNTEAPEALAEKVVNAGSVFLGQYACESAGDYASGTNHTLPTHGYAYAYSGVNLDSYMRKITFQHLSREGMLAIAPTVECMAAAEQLDAHRLAMAIRRKS